MLMNNIMLAISRRDTSRHICFYIKLFANNVHGTKYDKWCTYAARG